MGIYGIIGLHGLSNITKFRALTSLRIVDYTNRIEYNSLKAPDPCEAGAGAFLLFTNFTRRPSILCSNYTNKLVYIVILSEKSSTNIS
ncbi:hypothetical protein PAECIP111890_00606 [Paenibacillus sp. JJ-223]|nr:hypothetical protein PAECIP111890_00606 [Paenibacillus sp. JJ-223]